MEEAVTTAKQYDLSNFLNVGTCLITIVRLLQFLIQENNDKVLCAVMYIRWDVNGSAIGFILN